MKSQGGYSGPMQALPPSAMGDYPLIPGPLAEESVVAILLRGRRLARLMCTPRELDELALGYLFTRGLVRSRSELTELHVCPDRGSVSVDLLGELPEERGPERFVSSACGAGMQGEGDPATIPRVDPKPVSTAELGSLATAMRSMFSLARLHALTGGVHCAALLYESGEMVLREDVGRHNAVDKVVGRALLDDRMPEGRALLTSGRIAFDMVYKAAMAGIGIVVSRSIPTSAAYEFALDAGITLIGRALAARPVLYPIRPGPSR